MGLWNQNVIAFYYLLFLVLGTATTTASSSILEQTNSVPVRNARGELCAFTATEPGRYLLSGMARRLWYQPYCTMYIRAPPQTKVRLTFDLDNLDCEKSLLSAYDGWRVFDWFKKKHYSLPDDEFEEDNGRRERNMCIAEAGNEDSIETSQNAGQIFYRLVRQDSVIVTIDFIEDEQMCSVFISDKVEGLYKISNSGNAGVCKWYVTGAIIMTLNEVHLLNSSRTSCETSGNFLQVQSSSVSWRPSDVRLEQSFCKPEPVRLDHLLPCKFSRIELHTDKASTSIEQWVTFELQQPSEMEKEPFVYYCL